MRSVLALLIFLIVPALLYAEESGYIGQKECLACHKQVKDSYFNGPHGKLFTPEKGQELQAKGCEACHGPGEAHTVAVDREEKDLKIEAFKASAPGANRMCLACHEKGKVSFWQGNGHDMSGLGCGSCHKMHAGEPVPGMDICLKCHKERRAQLQRTSHMPLREGKMTCMNCHNPHGGPGPSSLKAASVNENCYGCHQDKRGPVLWEHAPVRENCANCHDPHGSNYDSLLKIKVPYLCQSCHDVSNHPGTLYDAGKLAAAAKQLLGKGCLNCHSLVHGSNHPSGARFQR